MANSIKKPLKPAPNGKTSVAKKKLPPSVTIDLTGKTTTSKEGEGIPVQMPPQNTSMFRPYSNAVHHYPYPYPNNFSPYPYSSLMMQSRLSVLTRRVPEPQPPMKATKNARLKNDNIPATSEPNPMQKNYPYMSGLGMSLDPTSDLATKERRALLDELLRFEEQEKNNTRLLVKVSPRAHIPHTVIRVEGRAPRSGGDKPPPVRKRELHRDCTKFLHALHPTDPTDAARTLCTWLAEHHNDSFVAAIDGAQTRQAHINVTMHDGGDRNNPSHTQWNIMYEKLVAFEQENGHCNVPHRKHGDTDEALKLSRWVSNQRQYKKTIGLSRERIALLDQLKFRWEMKTNQFADDPRMWNAIAVKICFGLTAYEAMLLAGYGKEVASKDGYKKGLNLKVWYFTKQGKGIRNQDKVEDIMKNLRDDPDATLDKIFGKDNSTLEDFKRKGKFVLEPVKTTVASNSEEAPEEDGEESSVEI